ncbi:MAG TPA: sigma-70 family RNA polymerase sigma factor [Planctomycetota bacterium]
MSGTRDLETVERLLASDPAAWERFTREVQPLLIRAAGAIARDAAEDVAQKVFAALLENDRALLRSFEGRSSLSTWLISIARNQALTHRRHERPRELPTPPADSPGPLEELLRSENIDRVTAALDALPPRERLILMLFYRDGLSYADIAGFLGVSSNSVSPLLERARNRLRAKM